MKPLAPEPRELTADELDDRLRDLVWEVAVVSQSQGRLPAELRRRIDGAIAAIRRDAARDATKSMER